MSLRIDHVIYAVEDLDVAGGRFRADFGLGSIAGGRHPHWGTANRIVPLGRDYVELVTVVDREVAAASDFGRPVLDAIAKGQPLVGWAARTDDLQAVANRLGLEVQRGSRTRPDGSVLAWQLAGVAPGLAGGALPFFIEWDVPPELHPGAADAGHDVSPVGIASIEVTGDKHSLHEWLGESQLPLRIVEGAPSLSAVAIGTATGDLLLR
ncbi:MAG TPA: VOC family protein [Solirubrobacteraceae bacterium]|nr:VOC family protein [Solirubrobacteraceae bacterium]